MPNRDASGRFTSAAAKTPIETLPEAVTVFEHLIRVMHNVARREQLCETYDRSIENVVDDLPFVTYDEPDNTPTYRTNFSISGYVYAPATSNGLTAGRAETQVTRDLRAEFSAWAVEHSLTENAFTFMAWMESLPDNRRASVSYDISNYADRARGGRNRFRPVHLRITPESTPAPEESTSSTTNALVNGLASLRNLTDAAAALSIDLPPAPGDRPAPETAPMQYNRCPQDSCHICDDEVRLLREQAGEQNRRLLVHDGDNTTEYAPDGQTGTIRMTV